MRQVYLLDTPFETFVWCGKGSDMNLRKEAVEGAQDMLKKVWFLSVVLFVMLIAVG